LLIRYRRDMNGRPVAKALVYTREEHRIDAARIDPEALRILDRLRGNGHEAYLVGGAVRDLLLGRRPKDFDIVTDAQPARIKRIFRNSRIIGRRFRLVHVYAGDMIYEVSTFRSIANGTVGNEYGTVDEDALRRDFSLNALYYDPHDGTLVDYVGGFKDIASRRIVPVIPLATIFTEDPVRMIRCVKYATSAGFRIPWKLHRALKRDSVLLSQASPSRLTEEFLKILASGRSAPIVRALADYDLLRHIAPQAARLAAQDRAFGEAFYAALAALDAEAADPSRDKRLALLLGHYLKPFLEDQPERFADTPDAYRDALQEARLFLAPLNVPRVELEAAVLVLFKKRGISPLQRPRRPTGAAGQARGSQAARHPADKGAREGDGRDHVPGEVEPSEAPPRPRAKRRRRPRGSRPGGEAPRPGAAGDPGPGGPGPSDGSE
jgi:poly(A) polymerase